MAFIVTVQDKDFAVSFSRDGDTRTTCRVAVGTVGQKPSEMGIVLNGQCKRHVKDHFDKGVGQAVALQRALKVGDEEVPRATRKAIANAHKEWLRNNSVRTKITREKKQKKGRVSA